MKHLLEKCRAHKFKARTQVHLIPMRHLSVWFERIFAIGFWERLFLLKFVWECRSAVLRSVSGSAYFWNFSQATGSFSSLPCSSGNSFASCDSDFFRIPFSSSLLQGLLALPPGKTFSVHSIALTRCKA